MNRRQSLFGMLLAPFAARAAKSVVPKQFADVPASKLGTGFPVSGHVATAPDRYFVIYIDGARREMPVFLS